MKHRIGYSRLNRDSAQRKALLRGLSAQLILNGRIETTLARAKALRSVVEKLVTLAKEDTAARRQVVQSRLNMGHRNIARTNEKYRRDGEDREAFNQPVEAVLRLFKEVGPKNASRPGGYTRIVKMGFRPGDHARRAIIEFVESDLVVKQ